MFLGLLIGAGTGFMFSTIVCYCRIRSLKQRLIEETLDNIDNQTFAEEFERQNYHLRKELAESRDTF